MLCRVRGVRGIKDIHDSQLHSHASEIKRLRWYRRQKSTVHQACTNTNQQLFCPIYAMSSLNPRTAYEFFLGKRVSDNHWRSVQQRLTTVGMEVTDDNVIFYAKLRKQIPRSAVNIVEVFEAYKKAEKLLALNNSKITGEAILGILSEQDINPHPATLSRWFKPLGGFRKSRNYYPEKLAPLLTAAFLYQSAKSTKIGD